MCNSAWDSAADPTDTDNKTSFVFIEATKQKRLKKLFIDFLNYDYKWMEHLKTVDLGGWGAKTLDDAWFLHLMILTLYFDAWWTHMTNGRTDGRMDNANSRVASRLKIGVYTEKLVFPCLWWLVLITHWFLGLYLGAIETGLPRAFRNGMTIGITPKNEVLRVKSLKQPILQEIKESSKFGNYGPP